MRPPRPGHPRLSGRAVQPTKSKNSESHFQAEHPSRIFKSCFRVSFPSRIFRVAFPSRISESCLHSFETQDDWNFLSLAASSQYHDDHPCMCTNSRINNVTNSCLAHITLSAACCVRAAAVVAAQWHSMLQFSACGAAAPGGGAGLQPGEPLKHFHGVSLVSSSQHAQ